MFFLHVQKCGGTSIKRALQNGFPTDRRRDESFDLDAAASTRVAHKLDMDNFAFRDQLLAYELSSAYPRLVMGHFRYTHAMHAEFLDEFEFVTVLRDPVERFLSAYFYDRYKDREYGRIEDSLENFLLKDGVPTLRARVHAEKYAAIFRGDGDNRPRSATDHDIAASIENLKRFALVGILDDLNPFVDRLQEWSDRDIEIPRLNTSPASATNRDELTPELLDVVHEICAPAQAIYQAVREHVSN